MWVEGRRGGAGWRGGGWDGRRWCGVWCGGVGVEGNAVTGVPAPMGRGGDGSRPGNRPVLRGGVLLVWVWGRPTRGAGKGAGKGGLCMRAWATPCIFCKNLALKKA